MNRKVMTIDQIRNENRESSYLESEDVEKMGVCALVDIEDMGFCKDGTTRWYHFTNANGEPCVYYKY